MAAGENGVNGKLVLLVVREEPKNDLDYVTTHYRNLKGKYVQWMVLWPRKHKNATKKHVQVSTVHILNYNLNIMFEGNRCE